MHINPLQERIRYNFSLFSGLYDLVFASILETHIFLCLQFLRGNHLETRHPISFPSIILEEYSLLYWHNIIVSP